MAGDAPRGPFKELMKDTGPNPGLDLGSCVIVGIVLGWACDRYLPWTHPWGFLALFFLGIAAGFWQLFRNGRS